jgi:hypothetical protein
VVRAVARHAEGLLEGRRPTAKLARVTAAQTRLWLRHIAAVDYNLLDGRMAVPPPFYAARLVLA